MTPGSGSALLQAYATDLRERLGLRQLLLAMALLVASAVAEGLGLLLIVPLLQLANGSATAPALRWLSAHGWQPGLGGALLVFVVVMLARAWLLRQRELRLLALRLDFIDALRAALEAALARAAWPFLARLRQADAMHLLFDQLGRVSVGTQQLMQLAATASLALMATFAVVLVAPAWTLLPLLAVVALSPLARQRLQRLASLGGRLGSEQRAVMSATTHFLAALKLVKAHAAEDLHLNELARGARRLHQAQWQFAVGQSATRVGFEAGGALLLAALLYGLSTWAHLGLAELLLVVVVFVRLLPALRDLQLQLQQVWHMLPAYGELSAWLQQARGQAEPAAARDAPPEATPQLQTALRLEGVSLVHEGATAPVLSGLDLVLPAGSCTALMGPSGAGKTTLVELLLGLRSPSQGRVWVDDTALTDADRARSWRRQVAYVAQDTYLFPGTLRENLLWLSGPRSEPDIWAALDAADATGFVRARPAGLDHPLDERGEGLSGGQRQRLALARALLCRPRLLVLDEATGQLDAESEERVLQALRPLRGHTTVLVVAHRAAVRRHVERTLMLVDGRLQQEAPGGTG